MNIIKGYLIDKNADPNEVLKVFNSLFDTGYKDSLSDSIKLGDLTSALNIVNKIIINTSRDLFSKPCSKKWNELLYIENEFIRYCSECGKYVYLISNKIEFEKRKCLRQSMAYNATGFGTNELNIKEFHSCRIIIDEESISDKLI